MGIACRCAGWGEYGVVGKGGEGQGGGGVLTGVVACIKQRWLSGGDGYVLDCRSMNM